LLVVYLVLLILSALLTVGALAFWLQANVPVGDTTAEALKKLRFRMFLASLAPLAGSTVTYFWYRYAVVHGGRYIVAYGPVLIGFFAFFARLNNYRQVSKRLQAQQTAGSGYTGSGSGSGYAPSWTPPS